MGIVNFPWTMAEDQHDSLLYLNPEPIRFEPVNKVTAVFFDETNKQVKSFTMANAHQYHIPLSKHVAVVVIMA